MNVDRHGQAQDYIIVSFYNIMAATAAYQSLQSSSIRVDYIMEFNDFEFIDYMVNTPPHTPPTPLPHTPNSTKPILDYNKYVKI